MTPYVSRLFIYPIKSLDGVDVKQATMLKSGAFEKDRELAIVDSSGRFVNGKRNQQIHTIRSRFELNTYQVTLQVADKPVAMFHLEQRQALEAWLSKYFGFPVAIAQNRDTGFPDDTTSPGPTIISTATLEAIASWYPNLDVEAVRWRFRANIEIAGVPAFWEDRLFTTAEQVVNFQIGKVLFKGINPCQRCVVVTRDARTGEADPNFQKIFITQRRATLPEWSETTRFNHFFRLAINTQVPVSEAGKIIRIGDELKI